jgi:NAD(P)-dependent dehydrogenase (short-subunit alcohol dehydrogenase family)
MKTILVTGASSGFGRALATVAVAAGHRVVGTLRNDADLKRFEAIEPGATIGRILDVTDTPAIAPVIASIERDVGPIDALVNNAGYGHQGTFEETPLDEYRRQFDVNVFGVIAVTQAVLPYLRKRRAGRILNITSMGGYVTFPGIGAYHGTKFALEGLSETLDKEVRDLGIRVTAVAPGGFRTDWAGRSMAFAEGDIADYDAVREGSKQRLAARNGKQPGDPTKAAQAMLAIIESSNPPVHVLLGSDAWQLVNDKLDAVKAELAAWQRTTLGTDFPAGT